MSNKQTKDNTIEISKLAKESKNLAAELVGANEQVAAVQTAVTAATNGVAALEAATTALSEKTNTIEEATNALGKQAAVLESTTSSLQIQAVGLDERLGVVEGDVETQSTHMAAQTAKIAAHEARIAALEATGGGTAGGDGGTHNAAADNFGTKYYSTQSITDLLTDYTTETFFATASQAKFPLCLIAPTGPTANIFFRINPLFTQKPHIKLWFWMCNLPADVAEIPCKINLNGNQIFDGILPLESKDFNAFVQFDVDPTAHQIVMFNTLEIKLGSQTFGDMFWEWVQIEVSNAHNPIVLNRNTDYEIYGLRKSDGSHRIFSSKFCPNATCMWIGGDNPTLENDQIVATYFGGHSINNVRLRWGTRYPQQNFENKQFTYTLHTHTNYLITQENKFYPHPTYNNFSTLHNSIDYLENVMYAKKSLHNGANENIECACIAFTDFSIGVYNAYFRISRPANFLNQVSFNLNGITYPKEFIDFIPVYDHNILGQKKHKFSCGYFLHHQSGNILFVPETQSSYFIKIGKGRQVHAFLNQDNLKIDVFYQIGNNVVQKTLVRETEESEWELTDNLKYYLNVEDVVPFQDFYYTIKNRYINNITEKIT